MPLPSSDTELAYRLHMMRYAQETAVLSFTKTDHSDFQAIFKMGWNAVPFLLKDVQRQPSDGGPCEGWHEYSFWGACTLLWMIVGDQCPVLPEKDRGRLKPIRAMWVKWGFERGYLIDTSEPKIPFNRENLYRFIPKSFSFGFRNYIWRLTTLPNRHRMKHRWDFWRAI